MMKFVYYACMLRGTWEKNENGGAVRGGDCGEGCEGGEDRSSW